MSKASQADDNDDVEDNHEQKEEENHSSSVRPGRCARCCHRWPRMVLLLVGVIIPLWILMMNCLLWGYLLAVLEENDEIKRNNEALVAQREAEVLKEIAVNVTNAVPRVCFILFFEKNATDPLSLLEDRIYKIGLPLEDPMFEGNVNTTELLKFVLNCTATATPLATKLVQEAIDAASVAADQNLTFNWVRCSSQRGPSLQRNISSLHLSAQTEFYTKAWETSRAQLQEKYLEENLENTTLSRTEALADASYRSLQDATGNSDDCRPNSVASGKWMRNVETLLQ